MNDANKYPIEPLLNNEKPFSTYSVKDELTIEDIAILREWKNSLVKLRNNNQRKGLYTFFNEELKRVIEFLTVNS